MTEDLLKEDTKRLLLFSTSSDGDLRGWALNPDNVRIDQPFFLKPKQYKIFFFFFFFLHFRKRSSPPNMLSGYHKKLTGKVSIWPIESMGLILAPDCDSELRIFVQMKYTSE